METIKTLLIVPDPEQPRKYFDPVKLNSLMGSIKREGIISPLIVEKVGDKYLLIDGERRFRAAQQLGLKEVPAIVEEPRKGIERLVRQFTVQEQHEGWAPIEKAMALVKLSEELKLNLTEVCSLLNIPYNYSRRYVAFASIANKEAYVRSELPLDFADSIASIKTEVRKIMVNELEKEFTRSDEKNLEKRLIASFKKGSIQRRKDITILKDAFKKNPKLIEKYLDSAAATPQSLYLEAGAQGVNALRNVMYSATYIKNHGKRFLSQPDVKLTDYQVKELKEAKDVINKILNLVE